MKKLLFAMTILMGLATAAGALTIYDIQYTNTPGVDNCYPSPYVGREVTLEGIVTGADYAQGGYFISEPISGSWRGIYIADKRNRPSQGDKIRVRGRVHESFGMTCLLDISSYRMLDRNYGLPQPLIVTTGQLSRADEAEAYEGVYARVLSASVASSRSKAGRFAVTDGSGQCSITTGSFSRQKALSPAAGTQFSSIVGIVVFGFSEFSLNPVAPGDTQIQQPLSTQNRSWGKIKSIYK